MRKGVVFSLDAILGILIVASIVPACLLYVSHTSVGHHAKNDIYRYSMDSLAVLEKDGTLDAAVAAMDQSGIQLFLDSMPEMICGNITVYSDASARLLVAGKSGCSGSDTLAEAVRVFISGDDIFYAKMDAWYG